jgi:hypothetical protein
LAAMPSVVSPFGAFGTRFKIGSARQREWLENPMLEERDMRPPGIVTPLLQQEHEMRPRRRPRPAGSPLAGDATGTMPSARELLSLRDGKDQRGARVRVCSVADALAGEGGVPAYAAVENEGGRAFATLRRSGDGEVERMQMSCLEVVDFGAHRVLVVPKNLDPSDLTIEDLRILELEDAVLFWEMVGRERQATYRDVSNGKPASLRLRPCAKQQRSAERRSDSLWTRLPPIPEVFCAEDREREALLDRASTTLRQESKAKYSMRMPTGLASDSF